MPSSQIPDRLSPREVATIGVLLLSSFVVILNETIMNVALPRLMVEFSVSAEAVQWLATAFMLTMAVVIPATGFLLRRFSTRSAFLLAMGLFSAGTLLAALAPGFAVLLAARVVQASGTAIMMPLLMTTILDLVPVSRRGVVMGNVSIVISVAPAIGPTLSGLVLHFLTWRFMFLLVLPIALAALFIGAPRLPGTNAEPAGRLSIGSVLLSVPGFGGLVFGLSKLGGGHGSGTAAPVSPDPAALVALAASVVSLAGFVALQLRLQRRNAALLDLRPFTYRPFTLSLLLMVLTMVSLFGAIILMPMYLQNVRGLDTLATGLLLLPGGLLMGVLAPFVGRLYDRFGPRPLVVPGALVLVVVLTQYARLDGSTPIGWVLALNVLMSASFAFIFTPAFTTGLNPLPHRLHSHGSALLSTLQQLGGAAGTALLVALMVAGAATAAAGGAEAPAAQVAGLQLGFAAAAVGSAGVLLLGVFLKKSAAEPQPHVGQAAPAAH
ncbi:MFS transporter [Zafaria cholistanensis]|uniref:MFS transporter n=1 Tax=Zafaria cholistanensis TaxID=1682741 RepID=A0A5A7NRR6_9MICC|nr:DHA2 family efflux MFS transporter permease subunit [Zafaria cholistanensis]GER22812.1 MFS transporter [Zafaria cholistanensis]